MTPEEFLRALLDGLFGPGVVNLERTISSFNAYSATIPDYGFRLAISAEAVSREDFGAIITQFSPYQMTNDEGKALMLKQPNVSIFADLLWSKRPTAETFPRLYKELGDLVEQLIVSTDKIADDIARDIESDKAVAAAVALEASKNDNEKAS